MSLVAFPIMPNGPKLIILQETTSRIAFCGSVRKGVAALYSLRYKLVRDDRQALSWATCFSYLALLMVAYAVAFSLRRF